MTSNGRLEEVVEALLERVKVLEQKAGISNNNIIKNPKLMVVENTVEPVEYTPEEVEGKEPIDSAVEVEENEEAPVEYEPETSTEDSKIEPTDEIPTKPKNTKKSKK